MTELATAETLAPTFLQRYLLDAPQYPSNALLRAWEAALFSGLQLQAPVLDLGCGDGHVFESFARAGDDGWSAFGLDINADSVAAAAARSIFGGAVVADARRMPWADAAFGTVVSVCVLEHIPGVEAVLAEVARVLKPGGCFAFSVPSLRLSEVAAQTHADGLAYVKAFDERVEHHNVWGADAWVTALQAAGLTVREVRGFMSPDAAVAWFGAYDWVVRPIRGRGVLYRLSGAGLSRFGVGRVLSRYWFCRLRQWASVGVHAPIAEACALFVVAERP